MMTQTKSEGLRVPKLLIGLAAFSLAIGALLPVAARAVLCCDAGSEGSHPTMVDCITSGCSDCQEISGQCPGAAPTNSATNSSANSSTNRQEGGGSSKSIGVATPLKYGDPTDVIGTVISTIIGSVGVIALIMFIYAGFLMMTAAGSSEKMNKGKQTMVWAVIGLFLVFTSYAIVSALIKALGVE